jgi:EmrB/QacA subfamily drug resistance transporter
MKAPCDQAVIESGRLGEPCARTAERWILAATILGSSMGFIDSTVVNIALPAIQKNLGGTLVDMQWIVEGYALMLSALILVGGSLGDLLGRRKMFLAGVIVFTAASCACGLAANIGQLVSARVAQGFGAAFLVPGSLSIISAAFSESTRGRAIGTWSGFTSITAAVGPVLGGWLMEHGSWRWVFFMNVPIALAVIAISLWRVPESRSSEHRKIDWLGALIVVAGLGGLTDGLVESGNSGWARPSVWGTILAGCVLLIAFRFVERRSDSPMVPFELFRSRDFSGANLLTLFLYAALGIFMFLFPLNLIQVQHYSATAAGAAAIPFILLMFLLSRWSGGLVSRYGAKRPLMIGPVIAAAGFVVLAIPSVGGSYWTTFFPGFVVLGLGMAISVAPLTTVVMESVDQQLTGTASGINNAVARVAGLLAVALLGIVMTGAFAQYLNQRLKKLDISADVMRDLKSSEIRLAAMNTPAGIDAGTAARLRRWIDAAFVFGFRVVMLICASLSAASSVLAWRMIRFKPREAE